MCMYSPKLEWAIVKLIKIKLSKLLNQTLCSGNFLILIRECGRPSETLWRQGVGLQNPSMSHRQGSWALAFGGGMWDRQATKTLPPPAKPTDLFLRPFGKLWDGDPKGIKGEGTSPLLWVPTTGRSRSPAQRLPLDPSVVTSFLLFLLLFYLFFFQHIRVIFV